MEVRKFVIIVEETLRKSGKEISPSHRKIAFIATVKDPLAGQFMEKREDGH